MAKKKQIPPSEEKKAEQEALNQSISRFVSNVADKRDVDRLITAISEASLSAPQLATLSNMAGSGSGKAKPTKDYYTAIAKGLFRVNFDATKESLKTGIAKAFPYGVRKAKRASEGVEGGGSTVRDDAAKIINNTKRTVEELEGKPDAFLSAWLASQGISGGGLDAFKDPLSPDIGFRWGDGGSIPSRIEGRAMVSLDKGKTQAIGTVSMGATDEDGQPTFQLADPKSIQSTQEKSLQSVPLEDFAELERSLASAAAKANSELWNGFWENMPQEAIAGFVHQPSSLPAIAWKALAARFKNLKVKKDTSPKEIADKIKAELDRQQDAISKATGNARGSKVSALKAAMPANVLDVMSQANVGDDLSGQPLTWQELLEEVGIQEIPFYPVPMSNESLKRMGVNPDQDERGVFFDALDFLPKRNVNPKEKEKSKSKKNKLPAKSKKHGPHRQGSDFVSLLVSLLEGDEEATEEELEALLEALDAL